MPKDLFENTEPRDLLAEDVVSSEPKDLFAGMEFAEEEVSAPSPFEVGKIGPIPGSNKDTQTTAKEVERVAEQDADAGNVVGQAVRDTATIPSDVTDIAGEGLQYLGRPDPTPDRGIISTPWEESGIPSLEKFGRNVSDVSGDISEKINEGLDFIGLPKAENEKEQLLSVATGVGAVSAAGKISKGVKTAKELKTIEELTDLDKADAISKSISRLDPNNAPKDLLADVSDPVLKKDLYVKSGNRKGAYKGVGVDPRLLNDMPSGTDTGVISGVEVQPDLVKNLPDKLPDTTQLPVDKYAGRVTDFYKDVDNAVNKPDVDNISRLPEEAKVPAMVELRSKNDGRINDDYVTVSKVMFSDKPELWAAINAETYLANRTVIAQNAVDNSQATGIKGFFNSTKKIINKDYRGPTLEKWNVFQDSTIGISKRADVDVGSYATLDNSGIEKTASFHMYKRQYMNSIIGGVDDLKGHTLKPYDDFETGRRIFKVDTDTKAWGQLIKDLRQDTGTSVYNILGRKTFKDTDGNAEKYIKAWDALDQFNLNAKRGITGSYNGFNSIDAAAYTIQELDNPTLRKFLEGKNKLMSRMVDDLVTFGRLSSDDANRIKAAHPNFVPFIKGRQIEGISEELAEELFGGVKSINNPQPIKKRIGVSELESGNALAAVEKYLTTTTSFGINNAVKNGIFGEILDPHNTNMLRQLGLPPEELYSKLSKIGKVKELDLRSVPNSSKSIHLWSGGTKILLTPTDEAVYAVMTRGLNPELNNSLLRIASREVSRAITGVISPLIFTKESFEISFFSPRGSTIYPLQSWKNIMAPFTNKAMWEEFQDNNMFRGGSYASTGLGKDMVPNFTKLEQQYISGRRGTTNPLSNLGLGFLKAEDAVQSYFDDITRYTVYDVARKAGYSEAEAQILMRKTGVDWGQSGYGFAEGTGKQKAYDFARSIPFFYTGVRALDRVGKLLRYDIQNVAKGVFLTSLAYGGVSEYTRQMSADDNGTTINDVIPEQHRMRGIAIPLKAGSHNISDTVTLPIGWWSGAIYTGIVAKTIEAGHSAYQLSGDPAIREALNKVLPKHAEFKNIDSQAVYDELERHAQKQGLTVEGLSRSYLNAVLTPSSISVSVPLVSTAYGIATGLDPITGLPISRAEGNDPYSIAQDYSSSTHPLAVDMGQALGISPREMDYILKTSFQVGRWDIAASVAHSIYRESVGNALPEGQWLSSFPVLRSFSVFKENTKNTQEFYNIYAHVTEVEKIKNSMVAEAKDNPGDEELATAADRFTLETAPVLQFAKPIRAMQKRLNDIDKETVKIRDDSSLTASQKRDKIITLGKEANQLIDLTVDSFGGIVSQEHYNHFVSVLNTPLPAPLQKMDRDRRTGNYIDDKKTTNNTPAGQRPD